MSDWFLPQGERPWTAGNLVVPHVHGAGYFARLVELVEAAQRGDRICFTDWRGDADELLLPSGPTVGELLEGACRRGVEVRALLWRSHTDKMRFNAEEDRRLGAVINAAGGEALSEVHGNSRYEDSEGNGSVHVRAPRGTLIELQTIPSGHSYPDDSEAEVWTPPAR